MKFWLIFMIFWSLVMSIYGLAATLSLGKDIEKKDKDVKRLETEIEIRNKRIKDLLSIIDNPHCRMVGFCEECKKAVYSENLQTYLCGIEEKENKDYCSGFKRKYES